MLFSCSMFLAHSFVFLWSFVTIALSVVKIGYLQKRSPLAYAGGAPNRFLVYNWGGAVNPWNEYDTLGMYLPPKHVLWCTGPEDWAWCCSVKSAYFSRHCCIRHSPYMHTERPRSLYWLWCNQPAFIELFEHINNNVPTYYRNNRRLTSSYVTSTFNTNCLNFWKVHLKQKRLNQIT